MTSEIQVRKNIISTLKEMNSKGINQGTSGNISSRFGDTMLISPSATAYDDIEPHMIAAIDLSGEMTDKWKGPKKPSTEWRFHWRLLKTRHHIQSVIHAHPPYCSTLAILRKGIPACHYMIAAFGGNDVKCSEYATFGSALLADHAIIAMEGRSACLLANHGMIAIGDSLDEAMWRSVELETVARQYYQALLVGKPTILSDDQVEDTHRMFADYGIQE